MLGFTVLQGGVSVALLGGIALSNFPEGMSSSSGLEAAGWPKRRVLLMWSAVVLVSGIAAALLRAARPGGRSHRRPRYRAFAAAPSNMVADTLLQAYAVEGVWTGTLVVIGFSISIALSAL